MDRPRSRERSRSRSAHSQDRSLAAAVRSSDSRGRSERNWDFVASTRAQRAKAADAQLLEAIQKNAADAIKIAYEECLEEAGLGMETKTKASWRAARGAAASLRLTFLALTPAECLAFLDACASVRGDTTSDQLLRCCSEHSGASSRGLRRFCKALSAFLTTCRHAEMASSGIRVFRETCVVALAAGGAVVGMLAGGLMGAIGAPAMALLNYFTSDRPGLLDAHWRCDLVHGGECHVTALGMKHISVVGAALGGAAGAATFAAKAHEWAVKSFRRPDFVGE